MVRDHLFDRTLDDNELSGKLRFTDAEIIKALQSAARKYNGLPPTTIYVNWNNLSDRTNIFLDGAVAHLYTCLLQKLMMNEVDYTAGGVTVSIEGKQIQNLKTLIAEFGKSFEQAARQD
jgi:hypothetical protein